LTRAIRQPKLEIEWIADLAEPYLRGFIPHAQENGGLHGYWFYHPQSKVRRGILPAKSGATRLPRQPCLGFFAGYILRSGVLPGWIVEPPECVVFAFVYPPGGVLHERLVAERGSLTRRTFEYIRWLTHRPPRFVFDEKGIPALARRRSMDDGAARRRAHLSRNFFIEALAWLVRSGLVRKFREESLQGTERAPSSSARSRTKAR
jgi:hypothetical protein